MTWDIGASRVDVVSVLDADPDLATGLTEAQIQTLRRTATARVLTVEAGKDWSPPHSASSQSGLGVLILEGLLARNMSLAGIGCPELLGSGDLLPPWQEQAHLVPVDLEFTIFQRTRMAILDDRFNQVVEHCPTIAARLLDRTVQRSESQAMHLAITCLRGVDVRLQTLFWHLAERWGKVTAEGIILDLPLTHEDLGRLVRTRRPSVSTALGQLTERGVLDSPRRGRWVLRGAPPQHLAAFDLRDNASAA